MAIQYEQCLQNTSLDTPPLVLEGHNFSHTIISIPPEIQHFEYAGDSFGLAIFIVAGFLLLTNIRKSFFTSLISFIFTATAALYLFFAVVSPIYLDYLWSKQNYLNATNTVVQIRGALNSLIENYKGPRWVKKELRRVRIELETIHHSTIALGVKHYLQTRDANSLDALISYLPDHDRHYQGRKGYSEALIALTAFYTEQQHHSLALELATIAEKLTPLHPLAKEVLYQTTLNNTFLLSDQGKFANGLALLEDLPEGWELNGQIYALSHMAERLALHIIDTQSQGFNPEPLQPIADSFAALSERQSDLTPRLENTYVNCHTADLLTFIAQYELKRNNVDGAIKLGLQSEGLVTGNPVNAQVIVRSYQVKASDYMEAGNYAAATSSLTEASLRSEDKDLHCQLSWVQGNYAMELISINEIDDAITAMSIAKRRCPDMLDLERMDARLTLAKGSRALQRGQFEKAREYLTSLLSARELADIAKQHLNMLPQLKSFLTEYDHSTGLSRLPHVEGVVCRMKGSECEMVELYSDDKRVGAARPGSAELQFFADGAQEFIVFTSHDNSHYFNEVIRYNGSNAVSMYDSDRDRSPDWRFDIRDGEIYKKNQLSGRIAVKFSAALSNDSQDWFSKPDMFIKTYRNGHYLGRTETQFNTYLPQYYTFAVIDYKHGDNVRLDFVDDDSFGAFGYQLIEKHEYMGTLEISQLPTTGFRAVNEHIGLYMDVRETMLPEGIATDPDILRHESHPFELDLAYENNEMTEYLLASYDAQAQTVWGELAGSIGMTDLMLMPVRNVTLMQRLILMFIGHEISYEVLTHTNDNPATGD
ncbi:hypothetical protein Q4520_18170 [Alteromonas sp. 1_MG-2023]|uniref:hypothetical protein n=1 Tax=Alteromonas sp. 1_MG-2023 TaxID=3062669 RepID=UPI0026E38CA4|nr:hypothetical protein [Alteromonas sp. 1_MG-2023]MDO6477352.1 hypothetical protein [Alteromonas sp. 1_MG-2023]